MAPGEGAVGVKSQDAYCHTNDPRFGEFRVYPRNLRRLPWVPTRPAFLSIPWGVESGG